MPLQTDLIHNGKSGLPKDASGAPVGWSTWHWMRLLDAMNDEDGCCNVQAFPYNYVFRFNHTYIALETDIWSSGGLPNVYYTFTIEAGDVYNCWR